MNPQPTQPHVPTPGLQDRAEILDLPWTGIAVLVAVLGLFFFMAFPLNGPSPTKRLAIQRERVAFVALERLRHALEDYRGDHGVWPGLESSAQQSLSPPSYSEQALMAQLKLHSDQHGATLPLPEGPFVFGPYLQAGLPINPQNGLRSVHLLQPDESFENIVDGIYGWIYDPRSGEIQPHILPFQKVLSRRKYNRRISQHD